jgi:hypothetical protein
MIEKFSDLKQKVEKNMSNDVQVDLEITLEQARMVENRFKQIVEKYMEVYGVYPSSLESHFVIQRLREHEAPSPKDFAREVVEALICPEPNKKLSKADRIEDLSKKVGAKMLLDISKKAAKSYTKHPQK